MSGQASEPKDRTMRLTLWMIRVLDEEGETA